LDIDSPSLARFSAQDAEGLAQLMQAVSAQLQAHCDARR